MSEYKRQVVDLLDFVRRLDGEAKEGKPQYRKAMRKAQLIALELGRPYDIQRVGAWVEGEFNTYFCSVCLGLSTEKSRYCHRCGARMKENNDEN